MDGFLYSYKLTLHTTETKAIMHPRTHAYDSDELHRIHALSRGNYNLLSLRQTTRSWIIHLGICKQLIDQPYRRSKAGRNMFIKIHTIVTDHLIRPQTAQVCLENLAHVASSSKQKSSGRHLRLSHINARSVCNKLNDLHQYINLHNIDLCSITETWIKEEDDIAAKELAPNGYKYISFPQRGGMGVVLSSCTGTTSQ